MSLSATSFMVSSPLMATKRGPGPVPPIPVGVLVRLCAGPRGSWTLLEMLPSEEPPPGGRVEAEMLLLTPNLSLPSIPVSGLPQIHRESPPGFSQPHYLLQKAALEKNTGKEHKPCPQTPSPCWGTGHVEGAWGAVNDPERIQHGSFRQRGLQVSTWFGFGSPLPSS